MHPSTYPSRVYINQIQKLFLQLNSKGSQPLTSHCTHNAENTGWICLTVSTQIFQITSHKKITYRHFKTVKKSDLYKASNLLGSNMSGLNIFVAPVSFVLSHWAWLECWTKIFRLSKNAELRFSDCQKMPDWTSIRSPDLNLDIWPLLKSSLFYSHEC